MKHSPTITLIIILTFLTAQLFGLFVIMKDARIEKKPSGEVEISHPESAVGPRPEFRDWQTVLFLTIAILIGSIFILILARFRQPYVWKGFYFMAVWGAIAVTLGVFIKSDAVLAIAIVFALIKVLKPNPIIHNLTEIIIYAGVSLIIVPLLTPLWASVLLVLVSVYDILAVWKSGHMITMAKFQMNTKLFSGLFIPYSNAQDHAEVRAKAAPARTSSVKMAKKKQGGPQSAILGGGDIVYPMIFSGTVMEGLIRSGVPILNAFLRASIIAAFATVALAFLLIRSEKGKFYPAMPFLSAGCFAGLVVAWLI